MKKFLKNILLDLGLYYKIKSKNKFYYFKDFYSNFLNKNSIVFEVGANVGDKTEILSSIAKKVYAFEPAPNCLKHLYSRFNKKSNVQIIPLGISNQKGISILYISDYHTMNTLSTQFIDNVTKNFSFKPNWNQQIEIHTTTLDDFIKESIKPDYIKLDIEGHEIYALKGLSIPIPIISFEMTPTLKENAIECIDYILNLSNSYKFNITLEESAVFYFSNLVTVEQIKKFILEKENLPFGDIYAFLSE